MQEAPGVGVGRPVVDDRVEVPVDISEDDAVAAARTSARVVELLAGAEPRRVIARPPALVNIVV